MPETLDLTAEELATWLTEHAPDRLWSVDGEDQIQETLSVPCSAEELAAELKRRGGRIRLLGPTGTIAAQHPELGSLSRVAHIDGDEIALHVAWLNDSGRGREWLIVTDLLAEDANRSAHAS